MKPAKTFRVKFMGGACDGMVIPIDSDHVISKPIQQRYISGGVEKTATYIVTHWNGSVYSAKHIS